MAKNEKTFDEQGMRKIIRILSGLSASQQQLAEQCINEYDPTKTYQKDSICFFNGTLYRAKTVTNGNEPSPDSTYFEMLDGVENEITAQTIEDLMVTTSAETWDYLKNFINDDVISTTHGYSSSKIYAEIQNAIQVAKDYALEQVANSSSGSYVIVNGTDEVVDDKHLFLISNGSNYDIYALVNGAPSKIGDTSVSLDGLLTEANAESTYLKQTDATSTYATITTTDGLRTDLDNHMNDAVAHMTQEEKDKLLTYDDITTTINSSSTDTEIPSAKSVYDAINATSGGVGSGDSYSVEEQLTGGTWIDGKPIYRKVIDFGTLPNSTTKKVPHGITNVDTTINIYGISSSTDTTLLLPHATTSEEYCIELSCDTTYIRITSAGNKTSFTKTYVTMEYTKTTD